jgi:hypothetical protein
VAAAAFAFGTATLKLVVAAESPSEDVFTLAGEALERARALFQRLHTEEPSETFFHLRAALAAHTLSELKTQRADMVRELMFTPSIFITAEVS